MDFTQKTIMRFFLVVSVYFISSCKPVGSDLSEKATADKIKTGFFLPKMPSQYSARVAATENPNAFAARIGAQPAPRNAEYLTSVTPDGEKVLLLRTHIHEAMPMLSRAPSGIIFRWTTLTLRDAKTDITALTGLWIRHKGDELKPEVSPDGNKSNMFFIRRPQFNNSLRLPIMVNWVDHLETAGGVMLYRVGNSVLSTATDSVIYSFNEIGNQVWQLQGFYRDDDVEPGSVFWSPDRKVYYSLTPGKKHVVKWRIQDKDSMDRIGPVDISKVTVPEIVKRTAAQSLRERQSTQGQQLALAGKNQHFKFHAQAPNFAETDGSHLYLTKRPQSLNANGFGLAGSAYVQENAPADESSDEYHAFYEKKCSDDCFEGKSFGLNGNGWNNNQGSAIPPWNQLPRLSSTQGKAKRGEGKYYHRLKGIGPSGQAVSTSAGNYFRVNHGGKQYLAKVKVAPYSKVDSITRTEPGMLWGTNTVTRNERSQKMELLMVPVDPNTGAPQQGSQIVTGTYDAARSGISGRLKSTGDVVAQHAAMQAEIRDPNGTVQQAIRKGRELSDIARNDMDAADSNYDSYTTSQGLLNRAGNATIGKLGGNYVKHKNLFAQSGATFGKTMHKATGKNAVKFAHYAQQTGQDMVVGMGQSVFTNANAVAHGNETAIIPSTAATIAGSFMPGQLGGGSANYQRIANKAAEKYFKQGSQKIARKSIGAEINSIADDQHEAGYSYSSHALGWGQMGADVAIDVAGSAIPGAAVPVEGVRIIKDQVVNIGQYKAAESGFINSNNEFNKASNGFMDAMANDPVTHQNSLNSFTSDLAATNFAPAPEPAMTLPSEPSGSVVDPTDPLFD